MGGSHLFQVAPEASNFTSSALHDKFNLLSKMLFNAVATEVGRTSTTLTHRSWEIQLGYPDLALATLLGVLTQAASLIFSKSLLDSPRNLVGKASWISVCCKLSVAVKDLPADMLGV
ncbi:hypothetical protein E6O75_ATG08980 [Venturia nashicola]|uniref:Uncharacterized protein n=1 Tax=Venturia nashicola TaxID=86259 RepID=A0A4Z1P662_9PEZI|nr:hypothetical protein E6O75_ATG08980 [Venturia nashicola]